MGCIELYKKQMIMEPDRFNVLADEDYEKILTPLFVESEKFKQIKENIKPLHLKGSFLLPSREKFKQQHSWDDPELQPHITFYIMTDKGISYYNSLLVKYWWKFPVQFFKCNSWNISIGLFGLTVAIASFTLAILKFKH